jgi:hypothetical protein
MAQALVLYGMLYAFVTIGFGLLVWSRRISEPAWFTTPVTIVLFILLASMPLGPLKEFGVLGWTYVFGFGGAAFVYGVAEIAYRRLYLPLPVRSASRVTVSAGKPEPATIPVPEAPPAPTFDLMGEIDRSVVKPLPATRAAFKKIYAEILAARPTVGAKLFEQYRDFINMLPDDLCSQAPSDFKVVTQALEPRP